MTTFPNASHDDDVDAICLALSELAGTQDVKAKWKNYGPDPRERVYLLAHGHRFCR